MVEILKTEYFMKWLKKVKDLRALAIINNRITRIELGDFGDCKDVGEKVKELRIHYGPGYRVYFTEYRNEIIILLIGGDKSSQAKDIEKAKKMAKELQK